MNKQSRLPSMCMMKERNKPNNGKGNGKKKPGQLSTLPIADGGGGGGSNRGI